MKQKLITLWARFLVWVALGRKKEDTLPMLRPVDLAIQSGVQNLSAFTIDEREEIMDGIAARAFPEKRHVHINPGQKARKLQTA